LRSPSAWRFRFDPPPPDWLLKWFEGSPSEFLGVFREYYGPTMNGYAAAAADGREEELHRELDSLFNEQNVSSSLEVTSIPATFLRVSVVV